MAVGRKHVLVAGHICLDITPAIKKQQGDKISDLLIPGKLVEVGAADIHLGGVVANTGLAMRILGADVSLSAKIGSDDLGRMIQNKLSAYDCQTHLTKDLHAGTSYTIVFAAPGIDRIFLHSPGANDTFCTDDISDDMLEGIDHFHFGYPPLMKRMYENNGEQLIALFKRMKNMGITTSLDLAAVDPAAPAGQVDWHAILHSVLPFVDIFLPSIEEIGFMLDRKRYDAWNDRAETGDVTDAINMQNDALPLADRLVDIGAGVAVLKCGKQGLCYQSAGQPRIYSLCSKYGLNAANWAGTHGAIPAFPSDRILSATGAGDVSIAAFLSAMLLQKDLRDCVRLAAAAGSCSLSAYDSLSALVSLETLEKRMQNGWTRAEATQ